MFGVQQVHDQCLFIPCLWDYSFGFWKVFPYVLSILPQYYFTSNGEVFIFFFKDLRDRQYGSGTLFHDHNHDRSSSMSTSLG